MFRVLGVTMIKNNFAIKHVGIIKSTTFAFININTINNHKYSNSYE